MTDPDPTDATEAAERAFARNLFAPDVAEPDESAEPDDDTRSLRNLFESPQVLCRSHAGCGSRLRAA